MKIIWGAALAFAVCSLNTAAGAETWSCDLAGTKTPWAVRYTVSNGRMTSSSSSSGRTTSAPGSLTVSLNDDRFLVAFAEVGKDEPRPLTFIIIEKKTGSILFVDNIIMTIMGNSPNNDPGPHVEDAGQCTLLDR